MKRITLSYLVHRGGEYIALHFQHDNQFVQLLSANVKLRWSRQNTCWYCPCTRENFDRLRSAAKKTGYEVDHQKLSESLRERPGPEVTIAVLPPKLKAFAESTQPVSYPVSNEHAAEMKKFVQKLSLKMYSASTVRTYSNELMQFLKTLGKVQAPTVSTDKLKDYFQYCHDKPGLSEATLHSRINALKFYYEQVLGREKFFWDISRPKKPFQLPKVLSEEEIGRLFNSVGNIKHKAMLFTAYSAGLRVSETVNLKISDVDSDRMQLSIERAKGK